MPVTEFEDLKNQIAKFSDEKFGVHRPFTAPLNHLKGEADEAIANGELSEFADMLLCLLDAFRLNFPGVHTSQLIKAAQDKLIKMKDFIWEGPDEHGAFQHKAL